MNEDEKMFHIGIWALGAAIVVTVLLQLGYRTQSRNLNYVRAKILEINKDIARDETKLEGYKRRDVVRDRVTTIMPRAENIGSQKYITIDELPDKK